MLGDTKGEPHNYTEGQGRVMGLSILARMRYRATMCAEFDIDDWTAIRNTADKLSTLLREGDAYEAILVKG